MVKDIWDTSISERRKNVQKYEKSKQLSEEIANIEEKQLYAARSRCSYDVFEELASERLMHLEITS